MRVGSVLARKWVLEYKCRTRGQHELSFAAPCNAGRRRTWVGHHERGGKSRHESRRVKSPSSDSFDIHSEQVGVGTQEEKKKQCLEKEYGERGVLLIRLHSALALIIINKLRLPSLLRPPRYPLLLNDP